MFMPGTYKFDNGIYTFSVIIETDGTWVTLDAPKAMTLKDFLTAENWTEVTEEVGT